ISYPEKNGLYENAFIFRRNNNEIKKLNEMWWSEYQTGTERDQFVLMYCLYVLSVEVNAIKIGDQFRKNPFVKHVKHKYVNYSIPSYAAESGVLLANETSTSDGLNGENALNRSKLLKSVRLSVIQAATESVE